MAVTNPSLAYFVFIKKKKKSTAKAATPVPNSYPSPDFLLLAPMR